MPRQKLGQHFLHSIGILQRIAAAACPKDCPLVVEIGAGRGALTEHLLERALLVKAIEVDPDLAVGLNERWGADRRFELVAGDALHVNWSTPQWSAAGPGVLVGNLPYYAATALISGYLSNPGNLKTAVFLIQKEVADRITAAPGTRDYGYLSVECQFQATVQTLFSVPPGAFRPPPLVDSSVIRLTPHLQRRPEAEEFLRFASACFRQKRKMLRNNLAGLFAKELLEAMPEATARAEQLPVEQLFRLYEALSGTVA